MEVLQSEQPLQVKQLLEVVLFCWAQVVNRSWPFLRDSKHLSRPPVSAVWSCCRAEPPVSVCLCCSWFVVFLKPSSFVSHLIKSWIRSMQRAGVRLVLLLRAWRAGGELPSSNKYKRQLFLSICVFGRSLALQQRRWELIKWWVLVCFNFTPCLPVYWWKPHI